MSEAENINKAVLGVTSKNTNKLKEEARAYFQEKEYGIWFFAAALGSSIILVGSVMLLILLKGFTHFMPRDLYLYEVRQKSGESFVLVPLAGEVTAREKINKIVLLESGYEPKNDKPLYHRFLLKTGNREYGRDFIWVLNDDILSSTKHKDLMLIERRSYGNFYGIPLAIVSADSNSKVNYKSNQWDNYLQTRLKEAALLTNQAQAIQRKEIDKINYKLEKLRLQERRMKLAKTVTQNNADILTQERSSLQDQYEIAAAKLVAIDRKLNQYSLIMQTADGSEAKISFAQIVRLYQTNKLGPGGKMLIYFERLMEFIAGEPRESNTEGGVMPAIFGTILMVLLMTIFVLPLGVIAAIYLYIYAKQNAITRTIRIAVNNLAGVPSIVFGMFGLGFFVYTVGGSIDNLFYAESLPSPTFGSGGILWASLTLALLTLPVVIVATEEGLTRIPRNLSEGSMALGATRFETLWRISIPIAGPSIMTGMILAIARATGEVAPLMLVGVVKLAPSLPIDGNFPFFHLDRKFMHLGFHIYDVGFQSPNVEAARPLIYATAALLLIIVLLLNAVAIILRNRLRDRYKNLS